MVSPADKVPTSLPAQLETSSTSSETKTLLEQLSQYSDKMMLWMDKYYLISDKSGRLKKIDSVTGVVEDVEMSSYEGYVSSEFDINNFLSFKDDSGKTILVPKKMEFSDHFIRQFKKRVHFNPALAQEIIDKILDGNTLTSICSETGMPSIGVLYKWRSKNPSFDEEIKKAIEYRRANFSEKLEEDLNLMHNYPGSFRDEKLLKVFKLKHNSILKLLGSFDREKQPSSGSNQIVNIQLNTGFGGSSSSDDVVDVHQISDDELK